MKTNVGIYELRHYHCDTNNEAPWYIFIVRWKPEVRPDAKKNSAFLFISI